MVKATLFGLIIASLTMMWTNREYVTEAYQVTENPLQVRLSGVDLAVKPTDVGPSPFAIPAAPDTRRTIIATVAPALPLEEAPVEIEMTGGQVHMTGSVVGPDGPIPGATVGIERLTSDGIGQLRVQANGAGVWAAARLPGGKYRIRAWIPGLGTSGASQVRYVAAEEQVEIDFTVLGVDSTPTIEFVHGGSIYAGHSGSVAMVMSSRAVDQNGVVVTSPVPGALVSIQTSTGVTVASNPTQLTDVNGLASFTLNCSGVSSGGSITATFGVLTQTFALPRCKPIPIPEPELPDPESELPDPESELPGEPTETEPVDG